MKGKFFPVEMRRKDGGSLLLREAEEGDAGAVLAYLNQVLSELYVKDAMTGMYNRLGYQKLACRMFEKKKQTGENLSIIFMDMDRLKSINDEFGHIYGDWAIKTIASAILKYIPEGAVAVRSGGDEFLVVLEQTADAEIFFDREEGLQKKRMIFTAAMNFKAEGGGVPMAPAASACDGKLSFCEAAGIPKWRTFLCLPFLVAAKHTSIHGFSVTDAKDCTIRLSRPLVVHADGEYCGEVTEVHFHCLPGKLRVLK